MRLMAQKIWTSYQSRMGDDPKTLAARGLRPFREIDKVVLDELLAPDALDPRLQAILRAKMNLPPPATSTNAPPKSG
jgi:hypothetical protein